MQKPHANCANCQKPVRRCCCSETHIQTGRFRSQIDKTMYRNVDMQSLKCLEHVIDQTLVQTESTMKDFIQHQTSVVKVKVYLAIKEFANQQKTENWRLKRDLKALKCVEKENKDITNKFNMLKNERDNEWSKRVQCEEKLKTLESKFSKLNSV